MEVSIALSITFYLGIEAYVTSRLEEHLEKLEEAIDVDSIANRVNRLMMQHHRRKRQGSTVGTPK